MPHPLASRIASIITPLPDEMDVLGLQAWQALKKDIFQSPPASEEERALLEGVARVIRVAVTYNDSGERFLSVDVVPSGDAAKPWYELARAVSGLAPSDRLWGALLDDLLVERSPQSGLEGRARYELAMRAVSRYVALAKRLRGTSPFDEAAAAIAEDAISRATALSLSFKSAVEAKQVSRESIELGRVLVSIGNLWTFIALSSVITRLASSKVDASISAADLDEVEQHLDTAAAFFSRSSGHRAERALHALGQLRAARGDKDAPRRARLATAVALEQEATRRAEAGGAVVAAHLVSEAIRLRQDNGDAAGAEGLRARVREYHRVAQERGELTMTESALSISPELLAGVIQPFLECGTLEDSLELVATSYLPTAPQIERLARDAESDITALVSTVVVRGDLPSAIGGSEPERRATAARIALWREVLVRAEIFLGPVMEALATKWSFQAEQLCAFLERGGNVPPRSRRFLETGARHFLSGDYLSTTCVWVPQIEAIVRGILARHGRNVTAFTTTGGGTFSEQTLGALLDDAKATLGKELVEYLRVLLSERVGLNLRNDLAHGTLDPGACNATTARLVLHILLVLSLVPAPGRPETPDEARAASRTASA